MNMSNLGTWQGAFIWIWSVQENVILCKHWDYSPYIEALQMIRKGEKINSW